MRDNDPDRVRGLANYPKFRSEYLLQQAVAKLLSKIPGIDDVMILHGAQEYGKDIVFRIAGPLNDDIHCACVIKNFKLSGKVGDSRSARSVLEQVEQALENPYLDGAGNRIAIQRVYVISPEEIGQPTIRSIEGRLTSRFGQVFFLGGHRFFELFQNHWPDFFADEVDALERYLKNLEAQPTSLSLSEMANLYNLGQVEKQESLIYVERSFSRLIRSYQFSSLFEYLPGALQFERKYNKAELETTMGNLSDINAKVTHLARWGFTASSTALKEIDSAIRNFQELLAETWLSNAKKLQFAAKQRRSIPSYLAVSIERDGLTEEKGKILDSEIREYLFPTRAMCRVTQRLGNLGGPALVETTFWRTAGHFDDCLCAGPFTFSASTPGTEVVLTEREIREMRGNVLIVGAAGYGKTSFCRRNCLVDARLLREGKSKVFPLYIALHKLVGKECESFEDAFLGGLGKSALLDNDLLAGAERIRLYLDGLDEVTPDQQRKLIELARLSVPGIEVQVMVTSRDYLFGEWLRGFHRIRLGALTVRELAELKTRWLGAEPSLLQAFDEQLPKIPALASVLRVPLLATLVMLVFRQKRSLPESRAGLYSTFMDLLSGGWDLAKGILRVSRFGRDVKLMVLVDIAATVHALAQRDFSGSVIIGSISRIIARADSELCEEFCRELLADGIIERSGAQYYFSHLSFQEFLAARYLVGDPTAKEANSVLTKYARGDDWWREVLRFYIGLGQNPELVTRWILNLLEKRPGTVDRVAGLLSDVREFFPSFALAEYLKKIGKDHLLSRSKLFSDHYRRRSEDK